MARHVPILAHRETLLWALENRSTVVIVGETGCGKSTQVPQMCLEAVGARVLWAVNKRYR